MVMVRDDIPKDMQSSGALHAYPGAEDSGEEDDIMAESYDIQMGMKEFLRTMIEFFFNVINNSFLYKHSQIWNLVIDREQTQLSA